MSAPSPLNEAQRLAALEERLRNTEAFYQALVETLPQNILRKDLQGRFTFANRKFCQSIGKPLDELIGKTDFDLFPQELAAKNAGDARRWCRFFTSGANFEASVICTFFRSLIVENIFP